MGTNQQATQQTSIMVVEDDSLLLQAIQKKLGLSGFMVYGFQNGAKALDFLKAASPPPDVIWLDYYLPDTNGMEILDILRKNNTWKKIPVLIVSNSASDEKVRTLTAMGAKKYILKAQHRLEDIISEINALCGR